MTVKGMKLPPRAKYPIMKYDDTWSFKECKVCNHVLVLSDFRPKGGGRVDVRNECRDCDRKRCTDRNKKIRDDCNWEIYLRQIYSSKKSKNADIGITWEDFYSLFQKQFDETGGKCPMTGVPYSLNHDTGGKWCPYAPSADQIIPSAGYTTDNIRFVSFWYNSLKSDKSDSFAMDMLFKMAMHQGWVQPSGE